jgi:hypothetical protein
VFRHYPRESTIRDDLDEVITISNVTILIGEWIPFGGGRSSGCLKVDLPPPHAGAPHNT